MRYEIIQDEGPHENPLDWDEWELHSFNTRHCNFKHPDDFGISVNSYGEVETSQIGLRRKLDVGTAFVLGYYEHGLCSWLIRGYGGPGTDCRWDGNQCAGILIWKGKSTDIGKTEPERLARARQVCETYTCWCNGEVFGYRIFDDQDEEIESCWGFYGYEDAEQSAIESIKEEQCLAIK
jgi:hypothetical protein